MEYNLKIINKIREYYKKYDICSSPKFYLNNFRSLIGLTYGMSNSTLFMGDLNLGDIEEGTIKIPIVIKEITIPCKFSNYLIKEERWERFKKDKTQSKYFDNDTQINEIGITKLLCDDLLLKKNSDNTKITNNLPVFYFYSNCKNIYPNYDKKSLCNGEDIEIKNPFHYVNDKRLYKNIYELYKAGGLTENTNLMIVEKTDGDISGLLDNIIEDINFDLSNLKIKVNEFSELLKSIFYQLTYILTILNIYYEEYSHNDLHIGNVLYKKKKAEETIFDFENKKLTEIRRIKFNDCGITIKLWDFATSYIKILDQKIKEDCKMIRYYDNYPFIRNAYIYEKENPNNWVHKYFSYMDNGQIFYTVKRISNDLESFFDSLHDKLIQFLKNRNLIGLFPFFTNCDGYKLFEKYKNYDLETIILDNYILIDEDIKKYNSYDNYYKYIIN